MTRDLPQRRRIWVRMGSRVRLTWHDPGMIRAIQESRAAGEPMAQIAARLGIHYHRARYLAQMEILPE